MAPNIDSDSDHDEVEELSNQLQEVAIDTSNLTPLSPEVISKQVSDPCNRVVICSEGCIRQQ
jgi:hypothetical protein